jgi:hypothetical protein
MSDWNSENGNGRWRIPTTFRFYALDDDGDIWEKVPGGPWVRLDRLPAKYPPRSVPKKGTADSGGSEHG